MPFPLSLFCLLSSSSVVPTLSIEDTLSYSKTGTTFIIAASSATFPYPRITRSFIRAAHLSNIPDYKFIVLDVLDNVSPSQFNITHFPAILYLVDGVVKRVHSRGFDEELILSFINTQSISKAPTLQSKEDLTTFYSENALGLLVAIPNATDDRYPELSNYYRDHFNEISLAYVNPDLVDAPGFYLYRYTDASLVKLPDLSEKRGALIAHVISENLVPEFAKFNGITASWYERQNQTYVILMLAMEDFYLTPEQLELAREIADQTGLNVTYNDIENTQTLAMRYGLPDSLDSTMAVIVTGGRKVMKYMLAEKLNVENAVKLVEQVKEGKAKPFWKSDSGLSKSEADGLTPVTATTLLDYLAAKKSLVLVVFWPGGIGENLANATLIAKQANKGVIFGKFSASTNDWPSESDPDFPAYPWLLVYVEGVKVHSGPVKETVADIAEEITNALQKTPDDGL